MFYRDTMIKFLIVILCLSPDLRFLFYLSFVSFTSCIIFPSLRICPVPLCPPPNKIQFKREKRQSYHKSWKCDTVSHIVNPFCPCTFNWKCSLQRIIDLVRSLWFLLHIWCWALTETPLGYPIVALCHGSAAFGWRASLPYPYHCMAVKERG